jgi:fatty-acyl-CoA synthase
MVLPGQKLDGLSVYELLEGEEVTFAAAVPTVWQMLLAHLRATKGELSTLRRVVFGGAAPPASLVRAFRDEYGVEAFHGWGMTEMSPLGTFTSPTAIVAQLTPEEQLHFTVKQGRPPLGVEIKLTSDDGHRIPHDGRTQGALKVRGPCVAASYFGGSGALDREGFFDTGDVATLDDQGYLHITDRAKDVIKSGGEWISSTSIENMAMEHPKALRCAVIGARHPKWDERPILLVQLKDGETASKDEFFDLLEGKITKWWMPDDLIFVAEIPLGTTGKIDKRAIREQMKNYMLPTIDASRADKP